MARARAAPASAPKASAPPPQRAPQPAQQQHHQQQQQQQQQPQQPQVHHVVHHHTGGAAGMAPRGPGLMGTMAAVAAGSVAGNMISNQLTGGHNQPQQQQPAEQQQQQPALDQRAQWMPPASDPCKAYFEAYAKCLEATPDAGCSWAWDMVLKCRQSNNL